MSNSPSTSGEPDGFSNLYEILSQYTEDIDLREICDNLHINYNRLSDKSHVERAHALARLLRNQRRLDELERELRRRLPERFSSPDVSS
jgi:hypothetical protein